MITRNDELVKNLEVKARKLRLDALFVMKEMGIGWLGGSTRCAMTRRTPSGRSETG